MSKLRLPNSDELETIVGIGFGPELKSMPYGKAIALVNWLIARQRLHQAAVVLIEMAGYFPDDIVANALLLHVRVNQRDHAEAVKMASIIRPFAMVDGTITALCIRGIPTGWRDSVSYGVGL